MLNVNEKQNQMLHRVVGALALSILVVMAALTNAIATMTPYA